MLYHELDLIQNTPEWEDWRFAGIGASDAPSIMGENNFKSSGKLLYEKLNRINPPLNEKMVLGSRLEGTAREKYAQKYGVELAPLCVQSVEYPWLRASLDAITPSRDHLVEIKCGESAYAQAKKGKVPDYYFGQLQHQLQLTGLQEIHYWCYLPDQPGIRIVVKHDERYILRLFEAEMAFYKRMSAPLNSRAQLQFEL
ncbi:MAG: hypothetical protein CVU65_16120 [Deltaproteobacteria bacterium HGW-Deltaproteobacteria-22]|jgi:putative phage-type endonuclease|nr:MAG: hypothetical protein CVU65_16120 [Deltaproteobacteria bacterium HGW-Deltaproteobacteria-22]